MIPNNFLLQSLLTFHENQRHTPHSKNFHSDTQLRNVDVAFEEKQPHHEDYQEPK